MSYGRGEKLTAELRAAPPIRPAMHGYANDQVSVERRRETALVLWALHLRGRRWARLLTDSVPMLSAFGVPDHVTAAVFVYIPERGAGLFAAFGTSSVVSAPWCART